MWWVLFVIFALVSITSSILLFFSLKRITQYEELILQFQQIISFSSEKMKQADTRGHYQSDDETSFFFEQLKSLQKVLDGVFETENLDGEKNNAKKEK